MTEENYSIDPLELLWREFRERDARVKEDTRWLTEFKQRIKELAGDAPGLSLRGSAVARFTPGQLNVSKLSKEHPEIIKKYTRYVTEHRFDAAAFQEAEPELYEAYVARRLNIIP